MNLKKGSTKCPGQVCGGQCADCSSPAPQGDPGAATGGLQSAPAHPPLPRSDRLETREYWTIHSTHDVSGVNNVHISPVDTACHGFDLDCVAKAGKDILGDGARIAGNGDKLCMPSLVQETQITNQIKISIAS